MYGNYEQSLKVGLHEWIMVDLANRPIKLWTNGLIGCVAVAIVTPKCAFVTHISSEIKVDGWEKTVKDEFTKKIEEIEELNDAIEFGVVGGDKHSLELFNVVLQFVDNIRNKKTKKAKLKHADGSQGVTGLSAYLGSYGPCVELLHGEDDPPLKGTLNSVKGQGYCKAQGFFSGAKYGAATL